MILSNPSWWRGVISNTINLIWGASGSGDNVSVEEEPATQPTNNNTPRHQTLIGLITRGISALKWIINGEGEIGSMEGRSQSKNVTRDMVR